MGEKKVEENETNVVRERERNFFFPTKKKKIIKKLEHRTRATVSRFPEQDTEYAIVIAPEDLEAEVFFPLFFFFAVSKGQRELVGCFCVG